MYPEEMTRPMEEELTSKGVVALKTASAVEETLSKKEMVLVVVNSVCGCAAGNARPGVLLSLQHEKTPQRWCTVFAGVDMEATKKAREFFTDKHPSSPSIALLENGKLVFMLERRDIEGRSPQEISADLIRAYESHC